MIICSVLVSSSVRIIMPALYCKNWISIVTGRTRLFFPLNLRELEQCGEEDPCQKGERSNSFSLFMMHGGKGRWTYFDSPRIPRTLGSSSYLSGNDLL